MFTFLTIPPQPLIIYPIYFHVQVISLLYVLYVTEIVDIARHMFAMLSVVVVLLLLVTGHHAVRPESDVVSSRSESESDVVRSRSESVVVRRRLVVILASPRTGSTLLGTQ